jgi:Ca-activated chloride channel family protein
LSGIAVSFASPWLLGLLVIVLVLAALPLWGKRVRRPASLRYAYTRLTASPRGSWRLTLRPALPVLRLMALSLIIVAAARPQAGRTEEIISQESVDIAIALDISGSMASLDFEPQNRLEAAKEMLLDFIDERPQDRIGLVVFAKEAFVQSPPTVDHEALRFLVQEVRLASDLRIEEGSAVGLGLVSAANLLKDSEVKSKVVILVTDGVNTTGEVDPLTAAGAVQALGIKVHTVGVGRPGLVPVPQTNPSGTTIVLEESELDEETLRRIAEATGGSFFQATDADRLQQIYDEINSLEKSQIEVRTFTRFQELAFWFLVPALAILVLELFLRNTLFRKIP